MKLVVGSNLFHDLVIGVFKHDEVTDQIKETLLVEDALDERLQLQIIRIRYGRPIDRLPRQVPLPA